MRLRAFTIVELLVAMTVSGLVVLGAYSLYEMLLKEDLLLQSVATQSNAVRLGHRTIARDIERCDAIVATALGWLCVWEDSMVVEYSQIEKVLLRSVSLGPASIEVHNGALNVEAWSKRVTEPQPVMDIVDIELMHRDLAALSGEPVDVLKLCAPSFGGLDKSACITFYKTYDAVHRLRWYAD